MSRLQVLAQFLAANERQGNSTAAHLAGPLTMDPGHGGPQARALRFTVKQLAQQQLLVYDFDMLPAICTTQHGQSPMTQH